MSLDAQFASWGWMHSFLLVQFTSSSYQMNLQSLTNKQITGANKKRTYEYIISGFSLRNYNNLKIWEGTDCAGLNPLSRTIQGNDPGTTACPPSARAGIGWHHCRTRNSISPHDWSTVMWPVLIGCWHRVSTAINSHQGRTQGLIGPHNWSIVMWLAPIGWWRRVSLAIYTTRTQDLGFFCGWFFVDSSLAC